VDIITIDFETYYDKDFSLSKITTEEYIRDPLFEVIGVAVKVNDGETEWFSGAYKEVKAWLHKFDWANSMSLAHNAMFDGAILNWKFGIKPKVWLDTLCMGRAIHGVEVGGSLKALAERYGVGEKGTEIVNALGVHRKDFPEDQLKRYGDYCINDVELTYKLFQKMLLNFPKSELKLIDVTLRMFTEPMLELDTNTLREHLKEVQEKKAELLSECGVTVDDLMSNPKFAEALKNLGVTPPIKISLTTGKEAFAFAKTDEGLLALQEHPDWRVQGLVAARLGMKSTLEETRTERFISIAERGALPVPIKYYAAHTGRFGGCLVADTAVVVYNNQNGVEEKQIVNVLLDDLVWDGEQFVPHEGVVFSGFSEVIEWCGVTGTEDHVVFTDAGEISLRDAMQGGSAITIARSPTQNDVDYARKFVSRY